MQGKSSDMFPTTLITGLPGTGMTVHLVDSVQKAIESGGTVIVCDPYGNIIDDVMRSLPEEKLSRTAYIDVGNVDNPIGLNLFDLGNDQDKQDIANTMLTLMYDLFDPNRTGIVGPRFEHAVRNAIKLMLYDEQATILELVRCFTDASYIEALVPKVEDPLLKRYWTDYLSQVASSQKSEGTDYIVSKFSRFVTDSQLRNILGQRTSTVDWRKLFTEKKIVLLDFGKLEARPEALYILGTLLLQSFTTAVKQREQTKEKLLLFLDEATFWPVMPLLDLLRNGRRFGVSLHISTQRIASVPIQLQKELLRIESLVSFRLATEDACVVAPQFHSHVSSDDICMLPRYHAYSKMLVDGNPQKARYSDFTKPDGGEPSRSIEDVKKMKIDLSQGYQRSAHEVEQEIMQRMPL